MASRFRILLLGAGGFVGRHLRRALEERGDSFAEVLSTSLHGCLTEGVQQLDILDAENIASVLTEFRPSHVVNLVGLSSPSAADRNAELAWALHVRAPEALGRLLIKLVPNCWLLNVGSGLVYGGSANQQPTPEDRLLSPRGPYAVSKAAGDLAIGSLVDEGLKCLLLRPFNHTGPGQSEDFVVPAFASQLARVAHSLQPPVLTVGNLQTERDFLDVRDVVQAYVSLVQSSNRMISGSVYNISSGAAVSMNEILHTLIEISGLDVKIRIDPMRKRKSEVPCLVGDSSRLRLDTDWRPSVPLARTLYDTYHYIFSREPGPFSTKV